MKKILSRTSFQLGLTLLLVIVSTEAAIMVFYHLIGVSPASLWAGIADALLLGVISSIVIFNQVVKPLKQAKQQNDLFNTVVNNLDVGVVVTNPRQHDHPIIYVNPAFTSITGYGSDEAVGKNPRFLQGDDVDQKVLQQTREAIHQKHSIRVTQRNRRKDGSSFWNDLHLNPILNASGDVRLWVGLINDVSETKALEKENKRWASALQQSDEAVCIFDEAGHIEFANASFYHNIHLSPADAGTWSVLDCWDKTSTDYTTLTDCLQRASSWSGRHTRLRTDQSSYESLTSITPIRDEQDRLSFIGVHRDITEMAAMENQLRQAQKMEAVGMLVSGIAHDFNNVLAGMLGNLYLIKKHVADAPDVLHRVESIEEQGYGAAGMVRQLLSFSRKDMPEIKDIDLVPFTKELVKFASVSVPENIELVCHVESTPLISSCDPVQLQQSLLNLIVNATHALLEKTDSIGKITVQASQSTLSDKLSIHDIHNQNDVAKQWACIAVRDNGIGMDQATRDKIFEPFFTTKPSGTGTGLGLAMVKGYIETLGGFVDVESQPGKGTCMSIYLHLHEDTHHDEILLQALPLRPGKGELILLADDNACVLEALSAILENASYHVLRANNGEVAMRLFDQHAAKLDMAILDMVMPKASGLQTTQYIHSRHENFPVVLMTGYDKEGALLSKQNADIPVLRKPWTISALNRILTGSLPTHSDKT